ncbi:MAG: RagB/SusD family nutrient uptake outer membrane protein [Dysgonamonadaceae bacterium]|jgi:hypothetical protein|nr:RagB/SusD family nutrient uptake outer membrane protein [Dysgonamonadaceae bacterium]
MKKYFYIALILLGIAFPACDDWLDVSPDPRTTLDSPKKVTQFLITAYPQANYALIAEFSADNLMDNQILGWNKQDFEKIDSELFQWQDVKSSTDEDSPYHLWASYYHSIAAANHALEAIEKLKKQGYTDKELNPQKGEALLIRAYSHFILVNIFAKTYKDSENSANDLGVAYITQPLSDLLAVYDRNSVAEVYNFIEKDLEEGIPLIDDNLYDVEKYHFNLPAAHAFASQFYLYKRDYEKVVQHADVVLGKVPSALLRDWQTVYSNPDTESIVYIATGSPANLLILPTLSVYQRRFNAYRYGWNDYARMGTDGPGPTWDERPPFFTGWLWTYGAEYGAFHSKIMEFFEYTDKVAGIGFPRIVRTEFTTDDVLLNRAEAKIMLNDYEAAITDLNYWNISHNATKNLTADAIKTFYSERNPYSVFFSYLFHTKELSPSFVVTPEQKPLIDCVLHFRRLERVLEGHRWFDIKRYGIEVTHYVGKAADKLVLTYDDDRRAIQIPSDVIGAGVEPNPRKYAAGEAQQSLTPMPYTSNIQFKEK